jgi:hypothetical protein
VSTVIAQPEPSLEEFVRDDVYQALIEQGFKHDQANAAARTAAGVTFSEVFKSALEWANNARRGFRVVPKPSQPKPKKESLMQTQTAAVKTNGHAPATLRTCKCGCGETVPTENRFAYIQGHLKRAKPAANTEKCHCGRPLGHTGKHVGGKAAPAKPAPVVSAAPPVSARVSLEVTEAQLNQFLVKLSLDDKQRLANYFLQTAE